MRSAFKVRTMLVIAASFAIVAAACSNDSSDNAGGGGSSQSAGSGVCATVDTSTNDALAKVCSSGTLRVATDQKYKPQSWYDVKDGQWKGFDVEVAQEIATRLGVAAELQNQDWAVVTAGSWNDRWDMNVGSMTVTADREKLFDFTSPYYFTPAAVAVFADNTSINDVTTDLDGKKVCVGESTTYESYLEGKLSLPASAPKFDYVVDNPQVVTFTTDTDALDNLALGDGVRCDAAISALPTIQQFINDGGKIKIVGDPIFFEPLAIAFDKNDPVDNSSLTAAVSKIVDQMHSDGTLTSLSQKWYQQDLTTTSGSSS